MAPVKYIFMDIVGYTKGRSVEAQVAIIDKLNRIVRASLLEIKVDQSKRILIPTGDGMCIALVEVLHPFDIHLALACEILRRIALQNEQTADAAFQFEVRIGLNENVDNIITDINETRSVAGMGINMAQRIMDNGDEGHLLLSQSVFSTLERREKYLGRFREYEFKTKHDEKHKFYQYVGTGEPGLNKNPPSALIESHPALPKLEMFDPNKYGNIFWVGHDLATTIGFLLSQRPREKILEGLYQSKHHLNEVGFDGTAIKSRLDRLYSEAERSSGSDWTKDRRAQVAQEIDSIAREIGAIIPRTQPGYKSHPS